MPPTKRFKKGEEVLGMWPGSRLYFKGTIVDVDEGTYDVKFEEGTTYTLLEKHVKSLEMLRKVEVKQEKSERVRRNRSFSFSRSRSRSRSRTPSRVVEKKTPRRSRRLEKSPKINTAEQVDKDEEDEDVKQPVQEDGVRRRSARLAARVINTPAPQDDVDTPSANKAETLQNGEDKKEELNKETAEKVNVEEETAGLAVGNLGAVCLLLFAPVLCLTLHGLCIQNKCLLTQLPSLDENFWFLFLDLRALYIAIGFVAFVVVSLYIPLGKVIEHNGVIVRCNGIYATLIQLAVFGVLKYHFHIRASVIQALYPKFFLPFLGLGFLSGFLSFAKQSNKSRIGFFYDLIVGTEVNTTVARVNVKHFLLRGGLLASIAINLIFIESSFESSGRYSTTLVLACSLQILYYFLGIFLEDSLPFTFGFKHEKIGLLLTTTFATFPFVATLSSYFLVLNPRELSIPHLILTAAVFLVGYIVLHGSIAQKALFRSNPEHPLLSEMEVLTTPDGGKLLLSGWWGWIRHPNYLGDLLVYLAFTIPCGLALSVPCLIVLLTVLVMVQRIQRVEKQCKLKYGPAWDRYCERVKYRLIPGVF